MDYILFGAGTGASLAVIGWILREWGPRLRDGKSDDDVIYSASELIDRMSWARFCASCGMAMVVAGTLILLATAAVAAWNPGDDLASGILVGMYLFVSLLLLVWAFLYTRQFGTSGIYRPVIVDPVDETLEAVPVMERETSTSPSDTATQIESAESSNTESPAEPTPDFDEVAARRGGLGRFASFFNRSRPESGSELDDGDPNDLPADTEPDRLDSTGDERSEVREVVVVAETDDDDLVERSDTVEVEAEETEAIQVVPRTTLGVTAEEPTAGAVGEPSTSANERSIEETPVSVEPFLEKPLTPVTPEDEALAELRRRRLARLSGGNQ